MESIINDYLLQLEFGELYQFENMAVVPLFSSIDNSPGYMVLQEALERKFIIITEVSQGASVPELIVINKADMPVLVIDGEELIGAKQNRVLNTTILLKQDCETVIPVSCVEQGRWSYVSRHFSSSDAFMPAELRAKKNYAVAHSLRRSGKFTADQRAIWGDIKEMAMCAGVASPTEAMKEVFDSKKKDIDEYLQAFKSQPRQKGLMVFINGEVMGFDMVSLESAQEKLYPKLLRGYAMNALLRKSNGVNKPTLEKAKTFVKDIAVCEEKKYQSTGHGWDYRYEGKELIGSALVFQEKVIHAAFFRAGEDVRQTARYAPFPL